MLKRTILFTAFLLATLAVILVGCQTEVPQPSPEGLLPTLTPVPEADVAFAKNAFPPPLPDKPQHHEAWLITDCMGCHSGDVPGEAPAVVHKDLPEVLLEVNCRTCHVLISEEPVAEVSR